MVYAGALLVIALLSGCASSVPVRYSKPGASIDVVRHDEGECAQAALVRTDEPAFVAPYPAVDRDAYDRCMRSRGYVMVER
jgi:hypothetical protein